MTRDKENLDAPYELKRPGLFAVRAILQNAKGGWGKFSTLVATTEGVRNRRDFAAYIRLLEKLDWLKSEELAIPISKKAIQEIIFLRDHRQRQVLSRPISDERRTIS